MSFTTHTLLQLLVTGMAIAAMACSISRSSLTAAARDWFRGKDLPMLAKLFNCPFCQSHWLAFFAVPALNLTVLPNFWLNWLVTAFALVCIATMFIGAIFMLVLHPEHEIHRLLALMQEDAKDKAEAE